MGSNIVKLYDPLQKCAGEVLAEAIDLNFETVVVVGVAKDKTVHIKASRSVNTLQLLGALSAAKMHVNEHWEDA